MQITDKEAETRIKSIFGKNGSLVKLRDEDKSDGDFSNMVKNVRDAYTKMKFDNIRPDYMAALLEINDGMDRLHQAVDDSVGIYNRFLKDKRLKEVSKKMLEVSNKKLMIGGADVSSLLDQITKALSTLDVKTATAVVKAINTTLKAIKAAGVILNSVAEFKSSIDFNKMSETLKTFETTLSAFSKNFDKYKIDQGAFKVFMALAVGEAQKYSVVAFEKRKNLQEEIDIIDKKINTVKDIFALEGDLK